MEFRRLMAWVGLIPASNRILVREVEMNVQLPELLLANTDILTATENQPYCPTRLKCLVIPQATH